MNIHRAARRYHRWALLCLDLTLATTFWCQIPGASAAAPQSGATPACPGGTYRVDFPADPAESSHRQGARILLTADRIRFTDGTLALDQCPPAAAAVRELASGTRLTARLQGCPGFTGKVRIAATLTPTCNHLSGRITISRLRIGRRFIATLESQTPTPGLPDPDAGDPVPIPSPPCTTGCNGPLPPHFDPIAGAAAETRLLVVGPSQFAEPLRRLVAHKNATGMSAFFLTMEVVRASPGKDDPERLKRLIERMHREKGTWYVMLAGDAGLIPVAHRFVAASPSDQNAYLDGTYNPSDLYYADLYRFGRSQRELDDWDLSGDGRLNYQVWDTSKDVANSINPDNVDGYPEVAVGRIPAHSAEEMDVYVDKVISYETGKAGIGLKSGYGFVADKNYPGSTGSLDALVADIFGPQPSKTVLKVGINFGPNDKLGASWVDGKFATVDVLPALSGWLTYVGHGSPSGWGISENSKTYDNEHVRGLQNTPLPIVYAAACETGAFKPWVPYGPYVDVNGTTRHIWVDVPTKKAWDALLGIAYPFPVPVPAPSPYDLPQAQGRSFASAWLLDHANGGAIAYFGETVVKPNSFAVELAHYILESYERSGYRVLGDIYADGQRRYFSMHARDENVFGHPRIYLGIMTLFGDPSLRLP